jgi:GT2 family glycosyltransferase
MVLKLSTLVDIKKFVSIIIVNWNGRRWLPGCLDSLMLQSYKNFEIILVDNASEDNSVEFVQKNYPQVIIVRNRDNVGFASGNNSALRKAKGELVLLLNNDIHAPKDYLEKFICAFDEIPNLGAAQSKLILLGDQIKLDSCGSFWTSSTFLYHYGNSKDQALDKYNNAFPVFTNKGASMLIRKDVIERIGLFDDDFWCYYEETDFCHRVWLAGYECWYYPKAAIFHAVGGTSNFFDNSYIQFHNFKNKLLSFLKNFEMRSLVKILLIFLITNVLISFIWLFQGRFKQSLSIYKAILWNITNVNETIKKRSVIQSLRCVSDRTIFLRVRKTPRLTYYFHLFFNSIQDYKDD